MPTMANKQDELRILARPARSNAHGNPYNALLADAVEAGGTVVVHEWSAGRALGQRWDVVHLHWPEAALNRPRALDALITLAGLFAVLDVARRRGARVVWTVHNLAAHEAAHPRLAVWFYAGLWRRLDGFIALSEAARAAVVAHFPVAAAIPCAVIPHGHYRPVLPPRPSRAAARRRLGLADADRVVLFAGTVRPYKNVDALVRAVRALPDPDLRLLVAGVPNEPLPSLLRDLAADDPRIRFDFRFVPSEELAELYAAADLVALPFAEVLNSGSALMALSHDRPVLVPRLGSLIDLAERAGPQWARAFEGELDAPLLAEALAWADGRTGDDAADLAAWDWAPIGAATAAFYRALLASAARR
jgi:glycosyltransferase involved in cell wall biosynthesis